jgi:hypothetical protein
MYQLCQLNITLEILEQLIELKHVTCWAKQTLLESTYMLTLVQLTFITKDRVKPDQLLIRKD